MEASDDRPAERVSFAVIERVADRQGVDVLGLDPLASTVDPAFLEEFVANDDVLDDSEVRFRYNGYTVVVRGDGEITLTDAD